MVTKTTSRPAAARPRTAPAHTVPARPSNAPSRVALEVNRAQRQLQETMQVHRRESSSAFERGERVRINRLRQQGQYLQNMAEQVANAKRGLVAHRPSAAHLEAIQHIYDDLADLRKRIEGGV